MPRVVGKTGEKMDFSSEILEKQKIIRTYLAHIGWSIRQFADSYCYDNNNCNAGDTDHISCIEKVKKQICSRCKTRKINGELNKIITYIEESDDFRKTNKTRLISISDGTLDQQLEIELKSISKIIDKKNTEKFK